MILNREVPNSEYRIYQAYGSAMAVILTLGIVGNVLSVLVLLKPEHRKRPISFLMLNMCFADLMVCVFGYSVALTYNRANTGTTLMSDSWGCSWLAFINCSTGIACIGTLTAMSFMSYKNVILINTSKVVEHSRSKKNSRRFAQFKNFVYTYLAIYDFVAFISTGITSLEVAVDVHFNKKKLVTIVGGVWFYAFVLAVPPMFGWNRFVPVTSKVSCHPNWASQELPDVAYIVTLTVGGFVVPLSFMTFFYLKMFRYMKGNSFQNFTANDQQRQRRLSIENKTIRCIIVAIIAFVVSWSPYCFISLSSTFKGHPIASPTVSLVPEIMAKASVMYNPIVYLFLNSRFRATLKGLFRRHRVNAVCTQRSLGDCGLYGTPRPKSRMEISPQSIEDPKHLASIGSSQHESQSSSKASGLGTSSNFVVPLPSVGESHELQKVTAFATQPVTSNPVHIHFVTVHKSYSDKH